MAGQTTVSPFLYSSRLASLYPQSVLLAASSSSFGDIDSIVAPNTAAPLDVRSVQVQSDALLFNKKGTS